MMSSIPCPMNLAAPQQCRMPRFLQHPGVFGTRPVRRADGFKARVASGDPRLSDLKDKADVAGGRGAHPRLQDGGLPELESYDDPSFFPKRQPGEFPSPAVRDAFAQFRHELINGAATGSVDEGDVVEFDPLRDGPARYLGYSNELGEAFAAWLPAYGVPLSYAVAIGYVLVDTADKGSKAYANAKKELDSKASLHPEVNTPRLEKLLALERTIDTVVWQLLASVACPGYTIHTVVELTHAILKPIEAQESVRSAVAAIAAMVSLQGPEAMALIDKTLPTLMGLAAIPFIVHPIDNGIHALMNATLRPAMRSYICGPGQGKLADLALCAECRVEGKTGGTKH